MNFMTRWQHLTCTLDRRDSVKGPGVLTFMNSDLPRGCLSVEVDGHLDTLTAAWLQIKSMSFSRVTSDAACLLTVL